MLGIPAENAVDADETRADERLLRYARRAQLHIDRFTNAHRTRRSNERKVNRVLRGGNRGARKQRGCAYYRLNRMTRKQHARFHFPACVRASDSLIAGSLTHSARRFARRNPILGAPRKSPHFVSICNAFEV